VILYELQSSVRISVGISDFTLHSHSISPSDIGAISSGLYWPERESEPSFTSSTEVKNTCSFTFGHLWNFMAWCMVPRQRSNFIFLLHKYKCLHRTYTS